MVFQEEMWLVLCLVALVAVLITHFVQKWRKSCYFGKGKELPPGSMGFPIIGETMQFFIPYTSNDIPPFVKKRIARYGPVFRTNLVGQPIIVSTDPEINHYIFQQEGKLFELGYTESFVKIFGSESLLVKHGMMHKFLRNLIMKYIGHESLKEKIICELNENTKSFLSYLASQTEFDVKEAVGEMIFDYSAKKLFSYDDRDGVTKMRKKFKSFLAGFMSFPLSIPGTNFHAAMQGRKQIMKEIDGFFKERKSSKVQYNDFLNLLIEELEKESTLLTENVAKELAFLVLFATYETTSLATTMALKLIIDHPLVLEELTKEHNRISKCKDEDEITWEVYRSMTFTHMVINEAARLANVAPLIIRKAMKDVDLKGYTIPAGWYVMVFTAATHLNSSIHENPLTFNPWRWRGRDLHSGSSDFMAFGGGVRLCVGADFAKLQIALFIHHLLTKYRWEKVSGGDIVRKPCLTFPNGLRIQIFPKI